MNPYIHPANWPTYTPPTPTPPTMPPTLMWPNTPPSTWLGQLHAKYCAWTCTSDDLDACWAAYNGIDPATTTTDADTALEGFA
ncbi:MAG: hypothetical protein AABY18_04765 [Candidatus Thermoplasmatota archaeon]